MNLMLSNIKNSICYPKFSVLPSFYDAPLRRDHAPVPARLVCIVALVVEIWDFENKIPFSPVYI